MEGAKSRGPKGVAALSLFDGSVRVQPQKTATQVAEARLVPGLAPRAAASDAFPERPIEVALGADSEPGDLVRTTIRVKRLRVVRILGRMFEPLVRTVAPLVNHLQ